MKAVPLILLDELNKWEHNVGEGDSVISVRTRKTTFVNFLIVQASTPTLKGIGRIEKEFEAGSQHVFFFKCKNCVAKKMKDPYHEVHWNNVHILEAVEDPAKSSKYVCPKCATAMNKKDRMEAVKNGKWIPQNPKEKEHLSFKVNGLCSPFLELNDMVDTYLRAKKSGSHLEMQNFYNDKLGETYELAEDKHDLEILLASRSNLYWRELHKSISILTMAADIQKNRIEVLVMGFGRGGVKQFVDHQVFKGPTYDAYVWNQLSNFIQKEMIYSSAYGDLKPQISFIDSGYETQRVYEFCHDHRYNRVFPIKGVAHQPNIVSQPKTINLGKNFDISSIILFTIGTDVAKENILGSLLRQQQIQRQKEDLEKAEKKIIDSTEPLPYIIPADAEMEFFKQLTAEKRIIEVNKYGVEKVIFVKERQNEMLDLSCYNIAASNYLKIPTFDDLRWGILEGKESGD